VTTLSGVKLCAIFGIRRLLREQLIGRLFWDIEPLIAAPLGIDGFERVRAEGLVRFPVVSLQDRYGRLVETTCRR
jgi:hypothetical protein